MTHAVPLFTLIRGRNSVVLSLIQLAQTMCQLHQPLAAKTDVRAEAAYADGMQCVEQLPEKEQTSMSFDLGRLRTALDELHSSQGNMK
jgi:hypothetical protein